jgi:3-oxoacid CoA-transferase subunit B
MIVTDLAVIKVTGNGFKLMERAPGVSVQEILDKTAAPVIVDDDIPEMKL